MPVYNAMPYLRDAIASVLEQSFRDLQLLIIDDGSTDDSAAYLRSVHDPRLTVLETEGRQGQGAARNLAIQRCETEYLAFADADDISLPDRFERQIAYMDLDPDVGMLGTRFAYIGSSGRPGLTPPLALGHEAIRRDLLLGRHAIANPTLMFRTSVFERTGAFRIDGAGEDWDLFLRMTEQTRVANLNQILCHYRLHPSSTNAQQAQTLLRRYAHACECARLREEHLPESSFEDFCKRQSKRSIWVRKLEDMNLQAGIQYRRGVLDILNGSKFRGYMRFGFAGLLSPQRLTQRVLRTVRGPFVRRKEMF
jgi:glycosyltransferase involved in cell wall biosynthesis